MKYLLFLAVGGLAYGMWTGHVTLDMLQRYLPARTSSAPKGTILTFEATFTPEQIMQQHQQELLRGTRSFGTVTTRFLPYLLLDVKYLAPNQRTEETRLLWGMDNGELVLNTDTFDSTKGFEDCLAAHATSEDFRILRALAAANRPLTREDLASELGLDADVCNNRLESLRKKHLVALRLDTVYPHFQSPNLKVMPRTLITQSPVLKSNTEELQIPAHYSQDAIKRTAEAAFGQDFAIRSEQIIFVPIYSIEVKNPDGSLLRTYWNSLTGKRVSLRALW